MIFRKIDRVKSFLSIVVLIWFASFSVFLNASHYHYNKHYNYNVYANHSHIKLHNKNISDYTLLQTNNSAPNDSTNSLSKICFVCLLLANLNFECPLAPPDPILSDTITAYNIYKPISFVTSPDLSQNNPRSPPC